MKQLTDFTIAETTLHGSAYALLKVTPADDTPLPPMTPGQFVQIAVKGVDVLLRRPISINNVDYSANMLWLLVRRAGTATNRLADSKIGERLNILLPLGNGFDLEAPQNGNPCLLVGGGVGIAPLLYLGKKLKENGVRAEYLIGAKTKDELLQTDLLREIFPVNISTDDGSEGERGLVTTNSCLNHKWDHIYCCGPAPMMKAVAKIANGRNISCEVSLENMMACGLGACLCCVEKTVKGNVCVCTEGPVFNINQLTWLD